MSDDANLSIGQQDQARAQAQQDEQWKQDDREHRQGSDPYVKPGESDQTTPVARRKDRPDTWHPGDAEQPDRDESDGLTGLGPVQY